MSERDARGFSGLATLVSDISADIADAERLGRFRQPARVRPAAPPPAPPITRAPLGGMSVGAKWMLGLGIVIAIVWLIGFLGDQPNPPRVAPPRVEIPSTPSPSVTVPPAPSAPSASAPDVYGVKPPVGDGLVLDTNQIRYCLVEDIRLTTISLLVDTRSSEEVDRFNGRIKDFNGRCASFKYRRGTLERVRQEIEAQRVTIENLARLQWQADK